MMNTHHYYAVYHAIDPVAMAFPQTAHWQRNWQQHFRHVADVAAPFEQVFARTNSIEQHWTRNPDVIWYDASVPLRSTSVGDVIVSCETGQAWMVMPAGFHALSL